MAVWEKEGWGTTNDCLQMVVDNYKTQGTTDRHSVNALESYLRRLAPPAFKVMFERSRTTTAQMIADVLGVDKLLDVYNVFMQEPGNTENARELRQRIEKLEQQNRIQQRNCDLAGDRRKPARTGQNRHEAAGRIKAGDRKTESGDLRHSFKEWRYLKKGETKK